MSNVQSLTVSSGRWTLDVGHWTFLNRSGDLAILIFSECFQSLSLNVSLTPQPKQRACTGFVIRSLDYADQIVPAHRHIDIFDLRAHFLESLTASIEPTWTILDSRRALLCPAKQGNVSWHLNSPFEFSPQITSIPG